MAQNRGISTQPSSSPPRDSKEIALLLAMPVFGVLILGWSPATLMYLYWLETGVVGAFNVLRMLSTPNKPSESGSILGQKVAVSLFFVFHFGIFWAVHGVFISSGLGSDGSRDLGSGVLAILIFVAAAESWRLYRHPQEPGSDALLAQMFEPYGRVIAVHITLFFTAFIIFPLGALADGLGLTGPASNSVVEALLLRVAGAVVIGFKLITEYKMRSRIEASSAKASPPAEVAS